MIFRFGAFEISSDSGELRKHGILVRLSPQPFQLLLTLIEHAGEVVSRDDLRERLWGRDGTSVEFDAGLNRCIRQIRAALNDDADIPRYIATVPRVGYRFTFPIEKSAADHPEPVITRRRLPTWISLSFAVLAIAVATSIWFQFRGSRLSSDLNYVPLAVARGDQLAPALSPDGRQVAFVWKGEQQNTFHIYLKPVGSSSAAPQRLTTSTDSEYSPAWSPDGQWIAFCTGTGTYEGAILIVPASGGVARKVVSLYALGSPLNRSISWSADSKYLVAADRFAAGASNGLRVIDLATGSSRQVTAPSSGEEDMYPAVSPDGRTIAFTRDTGRGVSSIVLIPFTGGKQPRVLPPPLGGTKYSNFYNARPAWTPDSSHIAFASNAGGNQHIWLVAARGSDAPVELRAIGPDAQDVSISADGKLAFTHETVDTNLWKLDLGSIHAVQIAGSTRLEQTPAISPDGTRLAFESNLSGYSEVWTSRADGSDPVQLTFMENPVTGSPDWSPDGRRILFDSRASGRPQLYLVNAGGGQPRRVGPANVSAVVPRWSPDGQSIYYSSDQTGRMEIWQIPALEGTPRQVTFDGGFAPMLSPDGEIVYYRSTNSVAGSLWQLRLANGKRTLVSSSVLNRAYAASPDGVFLFESVSGNSDNLFFFNKRSLETTRIFQADKPVGLGMVLAPGGHALYYTQLDQSGHELFLVKTFWK